jgi:cytochrome oxidase Cu insertion factor (SCO1/SenC/PrrC family)
MKGRASALLALAVSLGTVAAFVILLQMLVPVGPVWYLSALTVAVVLAAVAVAQSRRWLTMSALVVSVFLFALGAVFNFVLMRVPTTPSAFVVGQAAPDFTLPDSTGRSVSLADYRGRQPVVLVFYRGYW